MSFIDDHIKKVGLLHETQRSSVSTFFEFQNNGGEEEGCEHQMLRPNGGGEYFSNEFSEYLKEHGIQRKYSCNYSPHQNGVAERKNMHIAKIVLG